MVKNENGDGGPNCGTEGAAEWVPQLRLHRHREHMATVYSGYSNTNVPTELRDGLRSGQANASGKAGVYTRTSSPTRSSPVRWIPHGSRWTPRGTNERGAGHEQRRSARPLRQLRPQDNNFPTRTEPSCFQPGPAAEDRPLVHGGWQQKWFKTPIFDGLKDE